MVNRGAGIGTQMAGDAPLIRLNNGIEITGETKCYFDPRKIKKDAINCISHAHSDHLPRSFESHKAIASAVTLRCASERVKRTIEAGRVGPGGDA